jgi:hypothetical protein
MGSYQSKQIDVDVEKADVEKVHVGEGDVEKVLGEVHVGEVDVEKVDIEKVDVGKVDIEKVENPLFIEGIDIFGSKGPGSIVYLSIINKKFITYMNKKLMFNDCTLSSTTLWRPIQLKLTEENNYIYNMNEQYGDAIEAIMFRNNTNHPIKIKLLWKGYSHNILNEWIIESNAINLDVLMNGHSPFMLNLSYGAISLESSSDDIEINLLCKIYDPDISKKLAMGSYYYYNNKKNIFIAKNGIFTQHTI